jgi:two-component sensor histidine kinase
MGVAPAGKGSGAVKLERIERAIITPMPAWRKLAALGLGLGVATAIRIAIDGGASGVPFLTFYPVILLAAIFLGAPYAAAGAAGAALIASRLFMPAPWLSVHGPARIAILVLYVMAIGLMVILGDIMRRLVMESEAHARQQDAFNAELQHRTKNSLQIMRALIARGPRGEDPQTYFTNLAGRLDALAKANELLRFGVLEAASVDCLVRAAIEPFDDGRFELSGPPCDVARSAATPLVMALHELCTNAIKYGALSLEGGTIWLGWEATANDTAVLITWIERGGPPVAAPSHRGLGSRLLVANGGLARVDLDWRAEGLLCRIIANGAETLR